MTHTAKHTPGPWVGYTNTGEGRHIISEACTQDVIVCEQVHTDADISIIAAAPAMYAIIKDMREAFYVKGTRKALLAVMERSKNVLAQAEGRHHE